MENFIENYNVCQIEIKIKDALLQYNHILTVGAKFHGQGTFVTLKQK